ncbi:MAG: ATP-dependent Clp protease proteolytic subunit [Candidatus Hodgkinia cicadicola]
MIKRGTEVGCWVSFRRPFRPKNNPKGTKPATGRLKNFSPPRRKRNESQSRRRAFLIGKGPITTALATALGSKAVALAAKFKALDFYICSDGGEVNAGLAIFNMVQTLNAKVRTICFGRAHSVASLVLASGRSGWRKALIGSNVSLHRPSVGSFGNVEEVIQHVSSAVYSEKAVIQAYMKVCGRKLNEVRAAMMSSFAMNEREAKAFGLIDGTL